MIMIDLEILPLFAGLIVLLVLLCFALFRRFKDFNKYEKQTATQGTVTGVLGTIYMALYAIYINSVVSGASVSNIGEAFGKAVAISMYRPFFYCVLASALLALVGVASKNKVCVLLAFAATVGALIMLPDAFGMLVLPMILFIVSYVRMSKNK